MKRFSFPLSRVLQVRRLQQDRAQAVLSGLQQELNLLVNQQADLRLQKTNSIAAQHSAGTLHGSDLQNLSLYQHRLADTLVKLATQATEKKQQVTAQQAVVNDLERTCRLLERLRDQAQTQWRKGVEKELEEISADAYLSRMRALKEQSA